MHEIHKMLCEFRVNLRVQITVIEPRPFQFYGSSVELFFSDYGVVF